MSALNSNERIEDTSPQSDLTPNESFLDDATVAADLFDLAAPPLQQPLVARLLPVYTGLPTLELRQDSGTIVVGRGKELSADHRIEGCDKLSARHCEFIVDPITLRMHLRDISTNGTFVNGVRAVKNELVELQNGDKISLTRPAAAAEGAHGEHPTANSAAVPDVAANGRAVFIVQRLRRETTKADMLAELTCSICRGVFHRPCSVLPCMHVFCAGCISEWLRQGTHHSCPECREPITDVRPTHRLQNCADQFLLSDPGSCRPAEDLAALDAADTIPPTGLKLSKRQRHSSSDKDFDEDADGESSVGSAHDDTTHVVRHSELRYVNSIGLTAVHCEECDTPGPIDGFQCPAGGPHLLCCACAQPFAERPLCGRPQRCHLCNTAYCHLYRAGGCTGDSLRPFRPIKEHKPVEILPPQAFGGNTIEQSILSTYLASNNIFVKDIWTTTLAKMEAGEWMPDMVLINGTMSIDSAVCQRCAVKVFAELLFHYRRSIPADALPESVTKRSNCWYGKECRTQYHKMQHAQNFNHVCYQEKRKE
ncbi:hypothetical protein ABL78_7143 [Leptomonas seymouri]|uniref:E3 ubiquitin-protein ligase CHFR n=1 Tax=Leptomonas seymouri TaxID=5684 RepID=A0A0N0P377_LEPSE|nr:hypothetical protein ABL78_7143 [Leptomonas seymouri]|eukprot:KPI83809.1 hypothetical protein ABL78_7143 [Leptomonas seymouri]